MGQDDEVRARRAGRIVLAIYNKYDEAIERRVRERGATCREGCAHCCHLPASASLGEMVPVVLRLSESEAWHELRPKLEREISNRLAEMSQFNMLLPGDRAKFFTLRQPCVFLAGNRCTVYDVRPASCRYHYVVSPPENCSPLALDPNTLRIDLRKLEDLTILASSHELGEIVGGPIPAVFVHAARMLGVEFEVADESHLTAASWPALEVKKAERIMTALQDRDDRDDQLARLAGAGAIAECTCPPEEGVRDKDCPRHGLHKVVVPPGLREYRYPDGIVVHATSEADADDMHARMAARRGAS